MAAAEVTVLDPNSWRLPPQIGYANNSLLLDRLPEVFSCDLLDDQKLLLKTGPSTYTFPSGKTFHTILETGGFQEAHLLGQGTANSTFRVKIEGTYYLLRLPTYFLNPRPADAAFWPLIRKTKNSDYFAECVHLALLAPTPYVMKLIACECSPILTAMLLEYVEGTTLAKWKQQAHSKAEIEKVRGDLKEALKTLHAKQIVHFDIKGENVFVPADPDRPPFFLDFGNAGRPAAAEWAAAVARNLRNFAMLGGSRKHRSKRGKTRKSRRWRQ